MKFEILEDRRMMATDVDPVVNRIFDVRANYGQTVEVGTNGDFDKSGFVDFKDFLLVAEDLRTFNVPVKWSIPDQRSPLVNRLVTNGIAVLSISITNKNGTFKSECEILLGDRQVADTKCQIVADSTNLLPNDKPWEITVVFERQNISPTVSIASVTVKRLIDPAKLGAVKGPKVQLGVTDFRGLSIRRTNPSPLPIFPLLEQPYKRGELDR